MQKRRTWLAIVEVLASAALGGFALGGVLALADRVPGPWWKAGLQFGGATTVILGAAIVGLVLSLVLIRFGMLFLLVGLGMVAAAAGMVAITFQVESLDQGQRVMFAFVLAPMFGLLGLAMLFVDLKARFFGG